MKTIAYIWDRERQGAEFSIRSNAMPVFTEANVRKLVNDETGRFLMIVWMEETSVPFSGWASDNAEDVYVAIRGLVENSSAYCRELTVERFVAPDTHTKIQLILDEAAAGVATFLHVNPTEPANE